MPRADEKIIIETILSQGNDYMTIGEITDISDDPYFVGYGTCGKYCEELFKQGTLQFGLKDAMPAFRVSGPTELVKWRLSENK